MRQLDEICAACERRTPDQCCQDVAPRRRNPRGMALFLLLMMLIAAFFMAVAFPKKAHATAGGKYSCEWVNKLRLKYTDDQLVQKARRWQIPEHLIELAKACPRSSGSSPKSTN